MVIKFIFHPYFSCTGLDTTIFGSVLVLFEHLQVSPHHSMLKVGYIQRISKYFCLLYSIISRYPYHLLFCYLTPTPPSLFFQEFESFYQSLMFCDTPLDHNDTIHIQHRVKHCCHRYKAQNDKFHEIWYNDS